MPGDKRKRKSTPAYKRRRQGLRADAFFRAMPGFVAEINVQYEKPRSTPRWPAFDPVRRAIDAARTILRQVAARAVASIRCGSRPDRAAP